MLMYSTVLRMRSTCESRDSGTEVAIYDNHYRDNCGISVSSYIRFTQDSDSDNESSLISMMTGPPP